MYVVERWDGCGGVATGACRRVRINKWFKCVLYQVRLKRTTIQDTSYVPKQPAFTGGSFSRYIKRPRSRFTFTPRGISFAQFSFCHLET